MVCNTYVLEVQYNKMQHMFWSFAPCGGPKRAQCDASCFMHRMAQKASTPAPVEGPVTRSIKQVCFKQMYENRCKVHLIDS